MHTTRIAALTAVSTLTMALGLVVMAMPGVVQRLERRLAPLLSGNDLILVQGAGNVGKVARKLAECKLQPERKAEDRHG